MGEFDQATRFLEIKSPYGGNTLVLLSVSGREELSRPYEYHLELLSKEDDLDPKQIVGQGVTIRMDQDDSSADRFLHGVVRDFAHTGWAEKGSSYQATVVPKFWTLTQTTDCKIWQEKSTPEIVEEVFGDVGLTDFELKLTATYDPREYCVQYRETDFNFVSRLLEEEGVYYYFKHEDGKHTMVLADDPGGYYKLPQSDVELHDPNNTTGNQYQVKSWRHSYNFRSGKYAQTDYNFKTPSSDLMSNESARSAFNGADALEVYDYPGRHPDTSRGKHIARVRMEQMEAEQDISVGESTLRSFSPGGKFKFERHRSDAERGKEYVITSLETYASINDYVTGIGDGGVEYNNRFTVIPSSVPYRPKRETKPPVVEGPQTAVVVGPSGEEIYTDEHSRVKVQFHWDRYGKRDEKSSCWVRVSQAHAGKSWGYIDIPRIEEEVIVDFLEGDPDQPIITGRVYNAEQTPPFPLGGSNNTKNKTRRGNTTKTYKGQGYNEMSMDDTPGEEQIRVHAQYNMDSVVENDETLTVHNNRTKQVDVDEQTTIGNNRTEMVVNNETMTVGVNQSETVGSNRTTMVGANDTISVGANHTETIGMMDNEMIGISKTVSVGVAYALTVGGALNTMVGGLRAEQVGRQKLTNVGTDYKVTAGDKIELVCGSSSITLESGGKITINAPSQCVINGGGATIVMKGGIIDLN